MTHYEKVLEALDRLRNEGKVGRMYAVLNDEGIFRIAGPDFCERLGKDPVNTSLRSQLSTIEYEAGLRHTAFWAQFALQAKPDDVPRELAMVEREYARMRKRFGVDSRIEKFERLCRHFATSRLREFGFKYQLKFDGSKGVVDMNVNAMLIRDGAEYAGAILALSPYKDPMPWYQKVWKRWTDFEPHVVTDATDMLSVQSLDNELDVHAYMAKIQNHFNNQILARHVGTPTRPLIVNLRGVPDTVKPDYVKLLFHFVSDYTVKDIIVGNPSSNVYGQVKKIKPMPDVRTLVYRHPGCSSISELETFIESSISQLRHADTVSKPSLPALPDNPEGESLDVRIPGKDAEQ